jgi:dihydroflavonol-4-reductase
VRIERIVVVGATGLIGAAVARRLLADGHHVRLLVRDGEQASRQRGSDFEYEHGSVTDSAGVDRAMRGTDGVHISLSVEDPGQLEQVEHLGAATVAAAAAPHGVGRITYVHGPEELTLHQALRIYRQTSPNELLGAPTTTVEDWCRTQVSGSGVDGRT